MDCDRCRGQTSSLIMSKFNTQDLCENCKAFETKDPAYDAADAAEIAAVRTGVKNFPGVGLPDSLRKTMVENVIASNDFEGLLQGARRGLNDGNVEIVASESDACDFCKEPLRASCVHLSDVDELLNLCLPCGRLILVDFVERETQWTNHLKALAAQTEEAR